MCHSAYDANASSCTCQAKASPSGRWRFVPPKGLSIYYIIKKYVYMSEHQMLMVSLYELVNADHQYRKFKSLFNFKAVEAELLAVECEANYKGYGVERLFKCLLLQFMEDLSDRELERCLADSTEAKWFCDFALTENVSNGSKMIRALGEVDKLQLVRIQST